MKLIFLLWVVLLLVQDVWAQEHNDYFSQPVLPDLFDITGQGDVSGIQPGSLVLSGEEIDNLILGRFGTGLRFPSLDTFTGNTDTPLEFRRIKLFAESSRVWVGGTKPELFEDRPFRHFYLASNHDTGVGLAVDPVSGKVTGFASKQGDKFEISGDFISRLEFVTVEESDPGSNSCSTELKDQPIDVLERLANPTFTSDSATGAGDIISYQAVIAIETDNEWLGGFGNDKSAALTWIADTFLAMNVFYERDVETRLLIGEVFLRTEPDAYTEPSDRFAQLDEFGEYWKDNMGLVDRDFAAMFSGRNICGGCFSGIAWVDLYCENGRANGGSTAGSYSYNAIGSTRSPASTALFVGHEIGHNMGSTHTHCYNPPVDKCYNGESGCYSGTPECPVSGKGTVMSYCHVGGSSGAGCGSNAEFHPIVQSLLKSRLSDEEAKGCIAPYVDPDPEPEYVSSPAADSVLNFGDQVIGSESSNSVIDVTNLGGANLLISSCSVAGSDADSFNVNACPSTITPSATSAIQISCEPQTVGPKDATLTIMSNDSSETSVSYGLGCNGVLPPAPEFESAPAAGSRIDFGDWEVDIESPDSPIVITNPGELNLVIDSCTLSGAQASSFNLNACPSPVTPASDASVLISCKPQFTGPQTAQLTLNTNDSDESNVDFTLDCNGLALPAPEFESSPAAESTIDFGGQVIQSVSPKASIEVSNPGGQTLLLTACTVSGPDFSSFNVSACPASIAAETTADILVNCEPESAGVKTATLTVQSNDSDESGVDFGLLCRGVLAPGDDQIFAGGFEGG